MTARVIRALSWVLRAWWLAGHAWAGAGTVDVAEAWREVTEPSRVTLRLRNASPRKAYQTLGRESGNVLLLPEDDPENARRISLSVKDEPFWRVMQALEEFAPIELAPSTEWPQAIVRWRDAGGSPQVAFAGPTRVRLESCTVKRGLWQSLLENVRARLDWPKLVLKFRFEAEPRITVSHATLQMLEVIDQDGADLLARTSSGSRSVTHSMGKPGVLICTMNGRASLPGRQSKRLRRIRGKVGLSLIPALPPLRIAPLTPREQPVRYGRHRLAFRGTAESAAGWYTLFFASPEALSPEELKILKRTRLTGTNGLAQLAVSSDCKQFQEWPFRVRVHFRSREGCEPRAALLPQYVEFRMREYEFEFRNVPLPSQKAIYPPPPDRRQVDAPALHASEPPDGLLPLERMEAPTYTRVGGNVPLAEFLADVSRQTGVKVRAQNLAREPVVIRPDYQEANFWELMDDIAARYSLTYGSVWPGYFGKGDETRIRIMREHDRSRSGKGRPKFIRYFGPMRFCLSQIGLQAESSVCYLADGNETEEQLSLSVTSNVSLTSQVHVLRVSGGIQQCLTNIGHDLVPRATSRAIDASRYVRDPRCLRVTNTDDDERWRRSPHS